MNAFATEHSDTPDFTEFAPQRSLHDRLYLYCYGIGLTRWAQIRPIVAHGHLLVSLGDTQAEAVRKACALADDVRRHQ